MWAVEGANGAGRSLAQRLLEAGEVVIDVPAKNPPKGSLDILSTRIYSGFANSQFGYAAAESLVFMALIAVITWIQRRAVKASNPDA